MTRFLRTKKDPFGRRKWTPGHFSTLKNDRGSIFDGGRYSSLHRPYSDVAKYIFDIYYLLTMLFVYWFLLPLRLVWLLVCCLYKEVYLQIFKCVSFWLHGCCGEWEGGPVNQVNHTSWVAVVTPTDRPMSVRNCCLIELFCGVVCVVTLPFWHFRWCRGFCHRDWVRSPPFCHCIDTYCFF